MKLKKWDLVICIGLALLLLIFVSDLGNTNPAARTYPMVMIIACYFLISVLIIQWFKNRKAIKENDTGGMSSKRFLYITIYCAAILIYILLIEWLGYVVSTVLFGVYSLIYLKNRNKILIVTLPLAATLILYFLFSEFLFVSLPAGILI